MKITKDTKLGDIIPKGWVLNDNLDIEKDLFNKSDGTLTIHIINKSGEFFGYVMEYFQTNILVKNIIEKERTEYINALLNSEFNELPQELKLGVLKHICYNCGVIGDDFFYFCTEFNCNSVDNTKYGVNFTDKDFLRVMAVCPIEFLISTLE